MVSKMEELMKLVQDIDKRLIRIEEHISTQGKELDDTKSRVSTLEKILPGYQSWDKIKSIVIWLLCGIVGSMSSYIFFKK